ncbi:SDR family NAD(P)-dependent oxidoreductase [Verticiella sediminum]|uniref:SDR family NAD(P)-dependent oxidoreductase n=1 Tax=Verticiella sediminum TaxID=1247510 RepID=A0A556AEB5_9BURK|nr:SDR family NAD(P)-dependent oxidoreductase [Verticiella sediminum]TSH91232.1 SDR family NAD(P)-dependent oxidoreductase [Verticiella sediminum]
MELNEKVIVITGAFGQLGSAVARMVTRAGGRAALVDVVPGNAPDAGPAWQADLASLPDAERVMQDIAQHVGGIDGLVNVAGGFTWQTLQGSADLAEWGQMFSMNVVTCVNASKAVLPHLQRRGSGRIVNISAAGSLKAAAGMGAYAASKAGVARFTEALADELKAERITVNAVLPSIIDTPRNRADMPDADFSAWVTADEVASAIGFLLSDAGQGVTGALLPVTGRV